MKYNYNNGSGYLVMACLGTYYDYPVYEIGEVIETTSVLQQVVFRGNFVYIITSLNQPTYVDIFTHILWLFDTDERMPIIDILMSREGKFRGP